MSESSGTPTRNTTAVIPVSPGLERIARAGAQEAFREGVRATLTRIETYLLAGDTDSICVLVNHALHGGYKGRAL